jgi:3-oxoacyl-[acyl-carrier-protein] synthase-3
MVRSVIVGSGTEIPPNRVTNDMLARVLETSDAWVRERSGVETRYYVDPGTATSDLAAAASQKALEMAAVRPDEVDLVVVATMTPDHYFPGVGGILQTKLGLRAVPCFDIRQQCVGFLYGLQLADAYVRAGLAQTVLLVGAEVHSGFLTLSAANWETLYGRSTTPPTPEEWELNNLFRHLTVLFGDAGGAVVIRASEGERGVVDSLLHTQGDEYQKLYVPGNGFRHRPYVDAEQIRRGDHFPYMDGRAVFKMATTKMMAVAQDILARNRLSLDDVAMVLMHQANKRINEYVQKALRIPDEKVFHNIERYGNTTAGTIPLLWDECVRTGRVKPGDLVLLVAFGAGMSWGASLLRA